MTKFKDVAHLYLGCEVEWGFDGRKKKGELVGKDERYGWQVFDPSNAIVPYQPCRIELIKPLLRPLDSMTEEEKKEYSEHRHKYNTGNPASHITTDWAYKVCWLLEHHFDLFSLIPNNEAIDKNKL